MPLCRLAISLSSGQKSNRAAQLAPIQIWICRRCPDLAEEMPLPGSCGGDAPPPGSHGGLPRACAAAAARQEEEEATAYQEEEEEARREEEVVAPPPFS